MSLDILRKHLDRPMTQHLKPMLVDFISVFEDFENIARSAAGETVERRLDAWQSHIIRVVEEKIAEGEDRMQAIVQQLTDAVKAFNDNVVAHDAAIASNISALQAALQAPSVQATMSAEDSAAIQSAIEGITGASTKLVTETQALQASLAAPATGAAPPASDAPAA
jgi:kynureninase